MKLARIAEVARTEGMSGVWHRSSRRMNRILAQAAKRMDLATVPSAYGCRLAANWQDATFIFYVNGSYGYVLSDRLTQRSQPFLFLDIGANQGLYSLIAARNPACRGVWAFEPVVGTRALLERNIALNRATEKTTVIPAAISDTDGPLDILVRTGHSGGARIDAAPDAPADFQPERIDAISRKGLDALPLDRDGDIIVKIDVEGHEETVLRELLASRHARRITEIFYECDEGWLDAEATTDLLRHAGFTRFEKIGNGVHYDILALRDGGAA
jgi:FkbM family methyltransferase